MVIQVVAINDNISIRPVVNTYKTTNETNNKRLKMITYYCNLCRATHTDFLSDTVIIKGERYCKKAFIKMLN
jgi:hypothetical protein